MFDVSHISLSARPDGFQSKFSYGKSGYILWALELLIVTQPTDMRCHDVRHRNGNPVLLIIISIPGNEQRLSFLLFKICAASIGSVKNETLMVGTLELE